MPNSIITLFRYLTGSLLLLSLAVGCRQDEPLLPPASASPGGVDARISLTLRIPGFNEANTRAGVQEDMIREITVLMLVDEGGIEKIKVKHNVPAVSFRTPPGSPANTAVFSIPVTAGVYKRIALVANAAGELTAAGINVGSAYDALKGVEATSKFGQKGGAAQDSYIPMYGEYAPAGGLELKEGVSKVITQEIPLVRMLARVDVINAAASGATLNSISYINPVGNGRIWVDPVAYNAGYMAPTLPGTLQSANGAHMLEGTPAVSGGIATYYLCEQPVDSSPLAFHDVHRPCILVQMNWNGRNYWYRLDYTWDGVKGGGTAPYTKGTYMPLLRNHRYIFTIRDVKGPGFSTEEEALKSPGNHTNQNLVITPIVIDESFTDVIYNDMGHFLAVTRTEMILFGKHDAASTENKFSVRTSYPGGWNITAYNTNGTELTASNSWLRASAVSGAANSTAAVQALTNGIGFRRGYLEVRAGRLYTKVRVTQGGTPLDYVAEYNLAGGFIYGTSFSSSNPPGLSPTAAQTDVNLRWAANHNNNQSGYYSWFVCNGEHHATFNPDTKKLFEDPFFITGEGKGYHLPSQREWEGIFGSHTNDTRAYYKNNYSNSGHEAIEFGGIKKTFDADIKSTSGICYALRCKKATGDPYDRPLTDFPRATDNSLLCAYRYEREGSFFHNSLDSHLKVQCVYLGNTFTGDINTISNESWWNAQIAIPGKVTTRIFPITGVVSPAITSSSHSEIRDNGFWAHNWCQMDMKTRLLNVMRIDDYSADIFGSTSYYGDANTVRLFAGE